jgi:hypothetical protein
MLAALLSLVATGTGRAEVAVEPHDDGTALLVVQITEGPDPIPHAIWDPVGDYDPFLVLNRDGGSRGDGRPDVVEANGRPLVVWSYGAGADHDVALARWTDTGWRTEFVTAGTANELDPRLFVAPGGSRHVAWWVPPGQVYYTSDAGGVWAAPLRLTSPAVSGRRPSLATWRGSMLVAYERNAGAGAQEIAVGGLDNALPAAAVFTVPGSAPLDVMLHVAGDRLWMDWKQSATEIAYSVRGTAGWSAPGSVAWTDPSWLGEQEARAEVRRIVVGR